MGGQKKSTDVAGTASVYFRTLDLPLISTSTTSPSEFIRLNSRRPCTIGRSNRFCDFVFSDARVSRRHCQILFNGRLRKIFILDGIAVQSETKEGKIESNHSLNGVFVNGVRIGKDAAVELSAGDEVYLVCGNKALCSLGLRIGFVIQRVLVAQNYGDCKSYCKYATVKARSLLGHCRSMLQGVEEKYGNHLHQMENSGSQNFSFPPGKKFYMNRLAYDGHNSKDQSNVISLPELLQPINSLKQIFIATFTCDILWFLSYCKIPSNLPVAIACHHSERCWSLCPNERTSAPFSDFPNLVIVHPPFPEAIAFGNNHKKRGIACHHPKLFVLQRENCIRVIISSANLVAKQWTSVTNSIWWQDFPRARVPDYGSLFTRISGGEKDQDIKSDFAAQLAGFIACLVIDIPSLAHWVIDLATFDFRGAAGHLVASVPGIHLYRDPFELEPGCFSAKAHASRSHGGEPLGSVEASVVGLSHLFCAAADSKGAQIKKLATLFGKCCRTAYGLTEVVLRRNTNISADANAVSVLVSDHAEGDCVQLGFLPRNIARWVSPLWDSGFFNFYGCVCPEEALAVALGENKKKVQLMLYVYKGPSFSDMSRMTRHEHVSAFCSLIASVKRCVGLRRLHEVLGRYRWPESLETDFLYGSSSIGTSVNSRFLASFSAAAGKRSLPFSESEESDPEWGCWSISQESRNPSIRIIFPTLNRVKNAVCGILPSKRILCFSEKTWERLRALDILYDAIPHPCDRIGHPMHVKVARRRFQSERHASPFGWVYCGSHNFSAAAWGRALSFPVGEIKPSLKSGLHVCNYELGIIFVLPPPEGKNNREHANLDDIVLPFVVPPQKYGPCDRPATSHAMREALAELVEQEGEPAEGNAEEMIEDEIPDEEEVEIDSTDHVAEEKEEEKAYADILWSQVDSESS